MGLSENIENFNDYVSEAEALSDRYDDITKYSLFEFKNNKNE